MRLGILLLGLLLLPGCFSTVDQSSPIALGETFLQAIIEQDEEVLEQIENSRNYTPGMLINEISPDYKGMDKEDFRVTMDGRDVAIEHKDDEVMRRLIEVEERDGKYYFEGFTSRPSAPDSPYEDQMEDYDLDDLF